MTDVNAAFAKRIAQALRDIVPMYSDAIDDCADAKIEIERLREALQESHKQFQRMQNALMDATRPRQVIGEMSEYGIELTRSALQQKESE